MGLFNRRGFVLSDWYYSRNMALVLMKKNFYALGRLKQGAMNATESKYEEHLKQLMIAGDVLWYKFEGIKYRLADNTFYTPDFAVMLSSGQLEAHEVKGYWQDDAKVKIKVASELYPIRFVAIKVKAKKDGGGWEIEEF
jgi:hypothetical protein